MGVYFEDYRAGGRVTPDFGKFIQGGGSSRPTIQRGVLGNVPSDWEDPGRVVPQDVLPDEKNNPKRTVAGRWIYPLLYKAMKAVRMEEVETYVLRRQNTVA